MDISPGQWHEAVQALETALFRSAGFRDEADGHVLVYGYMRPASHQPGNLRASRRAIERYCARERLRLCGTFVDQGVGEEVLVRPGFTGLCDVLRLPDSFAAVVVSTGHLSTNGRILGTLVEQIRSTGARLLFVRPVPDQAMQGAEAVFGTPAATVPEWWR